MPYAGVRVLKFLSDKNVRYTPRAPIVIFTYLHNMLRIILLMFGTLDPRNQRFNRAVDEL